MCEDMYTYKLIYGNMRVYEQFTHTLTANSPIAQQALFATETISFSLGVSCANYTYKTSKITSN